MWLLFRWLLTDICLVNCALAIRSVPYKWLFQRCAAAVHHGGRWELIFCVPYFSIEKYIHCHGGNVCFHCLASLQLTVDLLLRHCMQEFRRFISWLMCLFFLASFLYLPSKVFKFISQHTQCYCSLFSLLGMWISCFSFFLFFVNWGLGGGKKEATVEEVGTVSAFLTSYLIFNKTYAFCTQGTKLSSISIG